MAQVCTDIIAIPTALTLLANGHGLLITLLQPFQLQFNNYIIAQIGKVIIPMATYSTDNTPNMPYYS